MEGRGGEARRAEKVSVCEDKVALLPPPPRLRKFLTNGSSLRPRRYVA